jgi:hypothetical protein
MASIAKIKTSGVKAIFQHANRTESDGHSHSNESIDLSRTKQNYKLKAGELEDWQKRLEDVFHIKRKDGVTFAEAVVTLPKDVAPKDERQFFQSCYEFFADDFGEDNVIYAVVHKDEVTPHLHLGFVPTVKGDVNELYSNAANKRNHLERWKDKHDGQYPQERISAGKLITREYLWELHGRMSERIDRDLGYHVSVLNGATVHGNKTVLELKVKSLQEKKGALEKSISGIREDAKAIKHELTQTGIQADQFQLYPLLQQIEALQAENQKLMDIIARNNCQFTLNEVKRKPLKPARSSSVSIYKGSLVQEQLPDNAVVVIELPNGQSMSPQQELINSDFDLRKIVTFAKNSQEAVKVKRSRTSERWFVMIKTDGVEQHTINNLILMEQMMREEIEDLRSRRIYMDRIDTDRYDLAKSILSANELTASYFEQKSVLEKFMEEDTKEETIEKE